MDGDAALQRAGRPAARSRRYIREHGVNEVYITLPLGSQPRIVELLGAAAGHHGGDLLRARRLRHQHHPGPAAGHERRAGGRASARRRSPAPTSLVKRLSATSCWRR
ncbi:MAG: hypothetical protein MZW92_73090 [Comamonadaceae bacterium]|nr:hypothetical protein [Comamonadaceae bacterium]